MMHREPALKQPRAPSPPSPQACVPDPLPPIDVTLRFEETRSGIDICGDHPDLDIHGRIVTFKLGKADRMRSVRFILPTTLDGDPLTVEVVHVKPADLEVADAGPYVLPLHARVRLEVVRETAAANQQSKPRRKVGVTFNVGDKGGGI